MVDLRHRETPPAIDRSSEAEFRSYAQWETEQAVAPLRLAIVALATFWWILGLRGAGAPWIPYAVLAGWILGLADLYLVRNRPWLARMMPVASAIGELVVLTLVMDALGPARVTLEPLFFIGVAGAGIRMRAPWNWIFAGIYGAMALPWTGPVLAGYVVLLGITQSTVSASMVRRIRRGIRDSLTGLFGREYAFVQMNELLAKDAFPFSVALADLDGFKGVNDRFGHPAGDGVLVTTARVLERCIRQEDLAARLGGDEFLIVFRDVSASGARQIAERIRTELESATFGGRSTDESFRLTVSVGVTEARPGRSAHQILRDVDIALYEAKANRNAVVLFGTGEPAPVETPS